MPLLFARLHVPHLCPSIQAPEHRLYLALSADEPDSAHSRYNALLRRLVSFERAAECAVTAALAGR